MARSLVNKIPPSLNRSSTTAAATSGVYFPSSGQSLFDVCLQLYGSLDNIVSLMVANNFNWPNNESVAGVKVTFELSKQEQSLLAKYNDQRGIKYATGSFTRPVYSFELREDGSYELREDGGFEIR
jgi:hypothetical protein